MKPYIYHWIKDEGMVSSKMRGWCQVFMQQ